MAAPTFITHATTSVSASTTLTITKPASVQDNDYLLVHIQHGTGNLAADPTAPSGWALISPGRQANSSTTGWFYEKIASSEPASWQWTSFSSGVIFGGIIVSRGADQTTPRNQTHILMNTSISGTSVALTVTTTVADCLLVAFAGQDQTAAGATYTQASMTELYDADFETALLHCGAYHETATTATTYGRTISYTAERCCGALFAIAPSAGVTAVGKDLALQWDTRAALGDTVQALWDVRAAVSDTAQVLWDARQVVGDPVTLQWDTRAIAAKSVQALWDARSAAGDTVQLVWDVQSALTVVGKDLGLVWNTRAVVGDTVQAIWDVRAAIGDTLQVVWDTRILVGDTAQLVWDLRAMVAVESALRWDIRAAVSDTVQALWDIRSATGKPVALLWNVESSVPPRDITVVASIRNNHVTGGVRLTNLVAEVRSNHITGGVTVPRGLRTGSVEYVTADVMFVGETAATIASTTGQMQITTTDTTPTAGDPNWVAADVTERTDVTGGALLALKKLHTAGAAGTYRLWAKVSDNPEIPILLCGSFDVR